MQDLEELKNRINGGGQIVHSSLALDLIARCESAEKVAHEWKCMYEKQCKDTTARMLQAMENGAAANALEAELKELREQQPAVFIDMLLNVQFNPEYKGDLFGAFYAAPVAQSRDSAEPYVMQWREIGESDWEITTDSHWFDYCQNSPLHDTRRLPSPQSNANAHSEPFTFIPWSKEAEILNPEALANSQQSPAVAVPSIEVTPDMLAAAQKHSKLGGYVCSNWTGAYEAITDLFNVMLSAAPQASAEQVPDPKAQSELERDATRYRWLRSIGGRSWSDGSQRATNETYDFAVDAEMIMADNVEGRV